MVEADSEATRSNSWRKSSSEADMRRRISLDPAGMVSHQDGWENQHQRRFNVVKISNSNNSDSSNSSNNSNHIDR
jgi:hypothetical protein